MNASQILLLIIAILIGNFLLENFLEWLNAQKQPANLPPQFKDIYTEDEYQKAKAYKKANSAFSLISNSVSFVITLVLLITGAFGWLSQYLETYFQNPIWHALAFFGVVTVASTILGLPFSLYQTFVIEEKFGFNKTTKKLFFSDKIKGLLLGAVVGGIIGYVLLYLILEIGQNFWIYFWIIITVFSVGMQFFYASLIMPLFNKLTPLEEGELRDAIEEYAGSVYFPLQNIFVIDGSKRSTKANAFFMGFGKQKKVVFYDTILEKHSTEELVAIFAHEVGHYKKNHILQTMAISILQTGITLFILSQIIFNKEISLALGANQWQIHLNMVAFGFLYSPISTITSVLFNIFSRKNEYEADNYAKETYGSKPLATALKKLSADSLSNLTPHPWYVFFNYSHPPLSERLKAMGE
ncbi:M48 family metallopeptidase [Bernardetia sp.]|uniref:M48 family metallopeptidase n=1 Tax=Bernardetia sp. TaxID=1937974 RepID=UPI0025BB9510|nr:M48 family metallopeptidase [Bernardetia sp.]